MEDILKSKQLQKVPFDCKVTCFDAKNGLLILGTEKKILWQRIQNDIWIEHSLLEVPLKALIHNHDDKICFSLALKSGKIGSNWFSTTKQENKIEVYDLFDEEFEITALEYDQGQLFIGTKEGTVSVFNFKTFREIGTKARQGYFGSIIHSRENDLEIVCSRPGCRLWMADCQGNVLHTLQFKNILEKKSCLESDKPNHGFSKLFLISKTEILTWNSNLLYKIDIDAIENIEFMKIDTKILDLKWDRIALYILDENGDIYTSIDDQYLLDTKCSSEEEDVKQLKSHSRSLTDLRKNESSSDENAETKSLNLPEEFGIFKDKILEKTKEIWKPDNLPNPRGFSFHPEFLVLREERLKLGEQLQKVEQEILEAAEFILSFDNVDTDMKVGVVKLRSLYQTRKVYLDKLGGKSCHLKSLTNALVHLIQLRYEDADFEIDPEDHYSSPYLDELDKKEDQRILNLISTFEDVLITVTILEVLPNNGAFRSWCFLLEHEAVEIKSLVINNSSLLSRGSDDALLSLLESQLQTVETKIEQRTKVLAIAHYLLHVRQSLWQDFIHMHIPKLEPFDILSMSILLDNQNTILESSSSQQDFSLGEKWLVESLGTLNQNTFNSKRILNWLRNNNKVQYVLESKYDQISSVETRERIGNLLTNLKGSFEAKLEICKKLGFQEGYRQVLQGLEFDMFVKELTTCLSQMKIQDISSWKAFKNIEVWEKVLELKSKSNNDTTIKSSWDEIGLEMISSIGIESTWEIMLNQCKILPKGSFSDKFYRTLITKSISQ